MAVKIKCKKCGKRFAPEIYSGLCPKCGTYNHIDVDGTRRTDLNQIQTEPNLVQTEPNRIQSRPVSTAVKREEPVGERPRKKRPGIFWVVSLVLVFLIPLCCVLYYSVWREKLLTDAGKVEAVHVEAAGDHVLVFGEPICENPIRVEVTQAGDVEGALDLPPEKKLVAIKAIVGSDGYNSGVSLAGIYLQYESNGTLCYRSPLDAYYVKGKLPVGVPEEQFLRIYSAGSGEQQEGYWFFCVEEDAKILNLQLELSDWNYGKIEKTLAEGAVDLQELSPLSLKGGEAEE